MNDDPELLERARSIRHAAEPGGPLDSRGPNATVNSPAYFRTGADGEPVATRQRMQMQQAILAEHESEATDAAPSGRPVAIVTAGPPGAGKSSSLDRELTALGMTKSQFHHVDPDDFKDRIFEKMDADGSLDTLAPAEISHLRPRPREMAPLVHEESANLAETAKDNAIDRGHNVIIDGTLANSAGADRMVGRLNRRGYQVHLVSVDADLETSQQRALDRQLAGNAGAAAVERGETESDGRRLTPSDRFGGRVIPPSVPPSMYTEDGQCRSTVNARRLAEAQPGIASYVRYRSHPDRGEPVLEEIRDARYGMDRAFTPAEYAAQTDRTLELGGGPDQVGRGTGGSRGSTRSRGEQPPRLHSDLQEIYDQGFDTPGGRAYFAEGDSTRKFASNVAAQPGLYTIDMHGTENSAYVGGRPVNEFELAQLVRSDPNWNRRDIFLLSCHTGKDENGYAKRLSRELGVRVVAPDRIAWGGERPNSEPYATSERTRFGFTRPTRPPDGTWYAYQPDGSRTVWLTPEQQADRLPKRWWNRWRGDQNRQDTADTAAEQEQTQHGQSTEEQPSEYVRLPDGHPSQNMVLPDPPKPEPARQFGTSNMYGSWDTDEPTTDEPTTDEPTTDEPTTDEPTTDEPTTDEPTTDEPTTDEPTTDEPTTDEPTTDEPTTDEPTTDEPTTDEPTTDEPTTDEPTTDEPTTDEPTTDEPTTDEPTTDEPTTDEPTTDEPTTDEPTTDEPTTDEPTTDEPTTDEPTTDEPTTDEPTTDEPTTDEPTTDEPTTDEPTTDEPTTDEPTTDEPTTDEPTTDEPTTDEPTTDEPTTDEPTTDEPTTDEPTTDEPTTDEPTTDEPTTDEPTTDEPTTDEPTTDEPTTDEPTTDEPTTDEPTTDEPTTDEPTTDEPTTDEPTTDEPTTDEPTTDEPTTDEPTTDEPTTDEPTADEPTADEPTADEPTADEPTADEPTADEPTADEPTADEPTADEPTADEPTADEPTADEPTADEPTADEPTADEPTADEPTADEPTADEPTADEPTADEPTADDSGPTQEPAADDYEGQQASDDDRVDDAMSSEQGSDWSNDSADSEADYSSDREA